VASRGPGLIHSFIHVVGRTLLFPVFICVVMHSFIPGLWLQCVIWWVCGWGFRWVGPRSRELIKKLVMQCKKNSLCCSFCSTTTRNNNNKTKTYLAVPHTHCGSVRYWGCILWVVHMVVWVLSVSCCLGVDNQDCEGGGFTLVLVPKGKSRPTG
jgi:hypothetical protein